MDAKLNRPLQKLHDQVKGIEDVRSSVSAMCEAFSNLLIEAKDNPEHVESIALQIGVNAAEWANVCVQNTPAVQERSRSAAAHEVC